MNASKQHEDERRTGGRLSDEELEAIARRAAEIVQDNFTLQVGKIAIRVVIYLGGLFGLAVIAWLGVQEHLL